MWKLQDRPLSDHLKTMVHKRGKEAISKHVNRKKYIKRFQSCHFTSVVIKPFDWITEMTHRLKWFLHSWSHIARFIFFKIFYKTNFHFHLTAI